MLRLQVTNFFLIYIYIYCICFITNTYTQQNAHNHPLNSSYIHTHIHPLPPTCVHPPTHTHPSTLMNAQSPTEKLPLTQTHTDEQISNEYNSSLYPPTQTHALTHSLPPALLCLHCQPDAELSQQSPIGLCVGTYSHSRSTVASRGDRWAERELLGKLSSPECGGVFGGSYQGLNGL